MAIDFTGGLSDDREYVFAEQPSDPEMRESVNTWVWDAGTDYGMPRIGVEGVEDRVALRVGLKEVLDPRVEHTFVVGRRHCRPPSSDATSPYIDGAAGFVTSYCHQ